MSRPASPQTPEYVDSSPESTRNLIDELWPEYGNPRSPAQGPPAGPVRLIRHFHNPRITPTRKPYRNRYARTRRSAVPLGRPRRGDRVLSALIDLGHQVVGCRQNVLVGRSTRLLGHVPLSHAPAGQAIRSGWNAGYVRPGSSPWCLASALPKWSSVSPIARRIDVNRLCVDSFVSYSRVFGSLEACVL